MQVWVTYVTSSQEMLQPGCPWMNYSYIVIHDVTNMCDADRRHKVDVAFGSDLIQF